MKAKVVREFYRVTLTKEEFSSPVDASAAALLALASNPSVRSTVVQRVTVIEHSEEEDFLGLFGPEVVTGEIPVLGARQIADDPALSRYHPNNGWVIPGYINLPEK